MLGKRFEKATREDIVRIVALIEQRQSYSAWTKRDYKIVLKLFYRWLYNCEKGELPPLVKWIRTGYNIPNDLKKSDLLTAKEIRSIVDGAKNHRDRALIMVLAESGRRLGEILTMRVGDIQFDSLGARLTVDGKMGQDYSRVINSTRQLARWLRVHPDKGNSQAPLWTKSVDPRKPVLQLRYVSAREILQECVKAAGISNKRVWFYLFRHTRGTYASTKLTAQQLCALMGWKQGSDMASVYIHLAAEDVDQAQAILNGLNPLL
jgi:integrase